MARVALVACIGGLAFGVCVPLVVSCFGYSSPTRLFVINLVGMCYKEMRIAVIKRCDG